LHEAENTVITQKDSIAHCEINLVHSIAGRFDADYLQQCTVYASTEPCPMCSGALYWSGIGRIVYALSKARYKELSGDTNPNYSFPVPAEELLAKGGRKVTVIGPVLEEEATEFYRKLRQSS
jgi:tRNA(Arg) A34 adenosine deaminase TadA